ncbi:hypothetical protein HID58_058923, partial [Brassica napus]
MILKISVRLLKPLTSRRMTLLLGRPDSGKSTLLLALADKRRPDSGKSTLLMALADKSLKLTESAKPKPTELFRVSSVRPTTCLGEHQQTASWRTINDRSQWAQHVMRLLYVKRGRLFLSSTSATHIYFDSETALGNEKFDNLKGLKAFAEAIDVVRDKGVAMAVAVASAEDIDEANGARPNIFRDFNFSSKHQTFTISCIFTEQEPPPLPTFVIDGGADVPVAELPGVETHSSADGKIPMLRRCQLLLKIH